MSFRKIIFPVLVALILFPHKGRAQLIERPDNPALVPFFFGLSTDSDDIVVSPTDRYVVMNSQAQMFIVDTADFDLAQTQPDALDSRTESYQFLPNSVSLFIHESDSFITRILADDPLNNILRVDLQGEIGTGVANIAMDPESIDRHLFILTFSDNTVYEYNISSQTVGDTPFTINEPGVTSLNNMTYIALPTTNGEGGDIDKIAVTTNNGRIVFLDENLNLLETVELLNTADDCPPGTGNIDSNVLPAAAVNTVRDLLFVLNSTDNVVHVVNTLTNQELPEPDSPICLHQVGPGSIDRDINQNIRDIVVTRVQNPLNAARGFVTGDLGVTLLNATATDLGVIDAFDTPGEDPDDIESIPLSANPDHITASSQSDGYVYTSNTNQSMSIISDNPFVTIMSIDPTTVTQNDPDFTITFQVDELCDGCSYRLRANGDIDESGTLLLQTNYTGADMVNTDLTTPAVNINDFPAGTFIEGENRIFLFSEDASGLVGRDSILMSVDTPPPDVVIRNLQFGNMRGFLTIDRLTQEDISGYNIYVLEALDQANPTCPGGLDFQAAAPTAFVPQPGSGDTIRITITGLTNGVAYCVGVEATDNGGNVSANIVISTTVLIPEVTAGITELAGETGCALVKISGEKSRPVAWALLVLPLVFLATVRIGRRWFLWLVLLFSLTLAAMPRPAQAFEYTDQHWAAQFQGGFYLPTDNVIDSFLGKCCNGMYKLTFGRLFQSRYEVNIGAGFMSEGATAVGAETGRESGERFNFTVVPISNSFVYRADYVENQLFVPYVDVGFDYMFFRENLQGDVTSGWKFGYHAGGGVQILMEWFDTVADSMEEYGINDVYLTLEGKWTQIDNFGGGGLSFTGFVFSAGILFEF